jgi:hypothetical protein
MPSFRACLIAIVLVGATSSALAEREASRVPETPMVSLFNRDGAPLRLGTAEVSVPAIVDYRGYPVFGPDDKLVPTPIEYDLHDKPVVGRDGGAILLTGDRHPRAEILRQDGQPLKNIRGMWLRR